MFNESEEEVVKRSSFVTVEREGEQGLELQSSQGWEAVKISVKRELIFVAIKVRMLM